LGNPSLPCFALARAVNRLVRCRTPSLCKRS
jgi:hypothetical protein